LATDRGFMDSANQAEVQKALNEVNSNNVVEVMDIVSATQGKDLGTILVDASYWNIYEAFNHSDRNQNITYVVSKLQERAEKTQDEETIKLVTSRATDTIIKLKANDASASEISAKLSEMATKIKEAETTKATQTAEKK